MSNDETVIYVIGFSNNNVGGFDWDYDRDAIAKARTHYLQLEAEGGGFSRITEVRSYTLDQLALDGNYSDEAITDALNEWPEAWEP